MSQLSIIPRPESVTATGGTFVLDQSTVIVFDEENESIARLLRGRLQPATGFDFSMVRIPPDVGGSIILEVDSTMSASGYAIDVNASGARLRGGDGAGLFCATQTFLQLCPPSIFRRTAMPPLSPVTSSTSSTTASGHRCKRSRCAGSVSRRVRRDMTDVERFVMAEVSEPPEPAAPPRSRRRPSDGLISVGATIGLLVLIATFLEIGARAGWWRTSTMPAPSTMAAGVGELAGDPQFWADAGRTGLEVGLSIVFGSILGLLAGLLFWKLPTLGRVFEPYLVSFYAVPMVLFYPVMIVIVGINASSVVILATIMATIPVALNTTVGLNGIRPVYLKLARSLECNQRQTLFQIAIPAAAPFIVAGLRLGVVYALIGAVAMEFVTAQAGLGYRIRYLYEIFDNDTMFAYILVVLVLSVLLTALLALVERLIVKGRTT